MFSFIFVNYGQYDVQITKTYFDLVNFMYNRYPKWAYRSWLWRSWWQVHQY